MRSKPWGEGKLRPARTSRRRIVDASARGLAWLCVAVLLASCSTGLKLQVVKDGPGDGRVTSTPAGIDCGAQCSAPFPLGTAVTLTAKPDNGSYLDEWQGCDASTATSCEVGMDRSRLIIPVFLLDNPVDAVTVTVAGAGVVIDEDLGFACDDNCATVPEGGQTMHLLAFAGPDATFDRWSGACSSADPTTCTVSPGPDGFVTATFVASTEAQLQPGPVTAATCGGAPCYDSVVKLQHSAGGYRGLEFVIISPSLRLTGVSLPAALAGDCFGAAGADKVIIVCPDDRIGDEDVATLSFERITADDSVLVLGQTFVVDGSSKQAVAGTAVLVRGNP